MSGGLLYAGYSILTMIAPPYLPNSSDVIDDILSFVLSRQMLLTSRPWAQTLTNGLTLNSLPERLGFSAP